MLAMLSSEYFQMRFRFSSFSCWGADAVQSTKKRLILVVNSDSMRRHSTDKWYDLNLSSA